jgi:hypothetical protein
MRQLPPGATNFAAIARGADEFVMSLSCDQGLASLLEEAPLGSDQVLEPIAKGTRRLRVTVRDSWELRWWLMGRADQIEVLAPAWLRHDISEALRKASAKYQ